LEKRIVDLEVKVAFQEALLAELDDVIQQLRARLDQSERDIRELREQGEAEAPADESQPPPHY
jgi:SlyX protein